LGIIWPILEKRTLFFIENAAEIRQ
jgi:hypothetical protein